MAKIFKRVFVAVAAAAVAATAALSFSACAQDGRDGRDFDPYDYYQAYNEELAANGQQPFESYLDFLEWILKDYVPDSVVQAAELQSMINRSLMCSVAVVSEFDGFLGATAGAGSGVIIDLDLDAGDAYIVTNAHVVYDTESLGGSYADEVYVYLYGNDVLGEDYGISGGSVINVNGIDSSCVEIVGCSVAYDLAVLKVTGSDLLRRSGACAAQFAQEEECYVGEAVYAVGNALGYGLAATTGVISRDSETVGIDMNGTVRTYRVLRTDAAINSGNSGGGLFNSSGQLVGIVNSKRDTSLEDIQDGSGVVEAMGAALPSSYARRVVQSMIDNYEANGAATYVRGAVSGLALTASSTSSRLNASTGNAEIIETVEVESVSSGSSAYGVLRGGDVIKSLSVGTMAGTASSFAASDRRTDFTVPEDYGYSVAQHYFTLDITRTYMVDDAMFSVREGDVVEIVFERNGSTMYAYLTFGSGDFSNYY